MLEIFKIVTSVKDPHVNHLHVQWIHMRKAYFIAVCAFRTIKLMNLRPIQRFEVFHTILKIYDILRPES